MCQLENLLMLIQQYFQICHTIINVGEEKGLLFSPNTTTLQNLLCVSRLQSLPSNQDLYTDKMRVQVRFYSQVSYLFM